LVSLSSTSMSAFLNSNKRMSIINSFFSHQFAPIFRSHNSFRIESSKFYKVLNSAVVASSEHFKGGKPISINLMSNIKEPVEIISSSFINIKAFNPIINVCIDKETTIRECLFINCNSFNYLIF